MVNMLHANRARLFGKSHSFAGIMFAFIFQNPFIPHYSDVERQLASLSSSTNMFQLE